MAKRLAGSGRYSCLAVKTFLRIDGAQWAGAFAFNAFFSLFPLMILLVTIASSFVDRDRAGTEVIAYMESYVPISGEMQRHIFDAIAGVIQAREQAGAVALLILVWAALQCFTTLICATNRAWGAEVYNWWRLPLKSLVLLGVTAGAVLLGMAAPVLAKMAKDWLFPVNDFRSWVYALGSFVIPLLVVFLSLSLFYRLAPRRPTRFAEVWAAALCATVALAGGRKSIRDLPHELRHLQRGLRSVWRDHGVAAVDLPFRVHFHLRRLPVRRSGRRASSAGGNNDGTDHEELNHDVGVPVKMRTGDALAVAREIARGVVALRNPRADVLGTNALPPFWPLTPTRLPTHSGIVRGAESPTTKDTVSHWSPPLRGWAGETRERSGDDPWCVRRDAMRKRTPRPTPKPAAVRAGRRAAPARPTPVPRSGDGRFPIVGIGASAGGLEALEEFFRHVPAGSGLAFVVVQHLDPTHKGLLPELLQRATGMPVHQIKDRTRVQPDCVYVIPPNTDLSILRGVLHLLTPAAPRGLRLPIDTFFRALAADWHEHSVAVLLSGMGTDGTLGVRAIKEQGGLVLVQEPATAKFASMPQSVLAAGLADVAAPAAALPQKLLACLQRTPHGPSTELPLGDKTESGLEKALILLRAHTGHDFSQYKKTTVYRRIERRMSLHQLDTIAAYVRYLQANPQEIDLLFKELLIGVTSFFRDPAAWEQLQTRGLPGLLAARPPGQPLRAWVPGCATGEEAYSLAIAVTEVLAERTPQARWPLQIFGTDLDRDAIDRARQGVFPDNIAADVSSERLQRFFRKEQSGYRVAPAIRGLVTFALQNVLGHPPFTKLDLLSCRNLLIYLDPELQKKLLPLFHYSLNPGGLLFLGSAETIGGFSDLFTPLAAKARLYQRNASAGRAELIELPAAPRGVRPAAAAGPRVLLAPVSLQALADQVLLQRYAPAAVLVAAQGDILYISGRTGKYLEPASGKVNWNVLAMAREGLRAALPDAIRQALRKSEEVTLRHLTVRTEGGVQVVDVTVQALAEPEALRGTVLIAFRDVAAVPAPASPAARRARGRAARPRRRARPGAATGPRRCPGHPGGDADGARRAQGDQRGAPGDQRGAAIDQRGAPVDQRGADHLQGRDAVLERGAPDRQRRAPGQGGGVVAGERRHEEPAQQHGHRHPLPGRRALRPALHRPGDHAHQADSRRPGAPGHRPRVRAAVS